MEVEFQTETTPTTSDKLEAFVEPGLLGGLEGPTCTNEPGLLGGLEGPTCTNLRRSLSSACWADLRYLPAQT